MKRTLITIMLGIFLISLASATTIYSGGCLHVNLSEMESLDNVTYDVIGNSSNLEGLTIELNEKIAEVCTVVNYKPDNFTLIFIDSSTKEVIKEVYYSGGSSSSSSSSGSSRVNQNTLTQGYTRYLYKNQKIFFTFKETHYVQFLGFERDLAKIKIQSEPIYIYLKVGDTKIVDLDNETIYITLLSKDDRGVNLFIQNRMLPPIINKTHVDEDIIPTEGKEQTDDDITIGIDTPEDDVPEDGKSSLIILGVIAIVLGIIVLVYWLIKREKTIGEDSITQ